MCERKRVERASLTPASDEPAESAECGDGRRAALETFQLDGFCVVNGTEQVVSDVTGLPSKLPQAEGSAFAM